MPKERRVAPCRVYVDPRIPRGWVELPLEFFGTTGIEPNRHIVVRHRKLQVKLRGRVSELLEACEVSISPHLAVFLDVRQADLLDVEDHATVLEGLMDDVESFDDVLEQSAARLSGIIEEEGVSFEGRTVLDVLDQLIAHKESPERSYLVVPPNPEGTGVPRGEICEDPSLDVKEWRPDDGTGKVRLFRPGGESEK
jgi:hypothetical protein